MVEKCIRMWRVLTIFLVNSLGLKLFYHRWYHFQTIFYIYVKQKIRIKFAQYIPFKCINKLIVSFIVPVSGYYIYYFYMCMRVSLRDCLWK